MCGRFIEFSPIGSLISEFALDEAGGVVHRPSYNIAPGRDVLAVVNEQDKRELTALRWGLIPHWAKDEAIGFKMINARAETLAEKASFRRPFRQQRCLIVTDGFYEWQKAGSRKIPYFIRLRRESPFAFAGLFDTWFSPQHELIRSCTIITTESNALVAPIHDRMPVILPSDHYDAWLDRRNDNVAALQSYLVPFDSAAMRSYPVDSAMNRPDHDSPENILPLA